MTKILLFLCIILESHLFLILFLVNFHLVIAENFAKMVLFRK